MEGLGIVGTSFAEQRADYRKVRCITHAAGAAICNLCEAPAMFTQSGSHPRRPGCRGPFALTDDFTLSAIAPGTARCYVGSIRRRLCRDLAQMVRCSGCCDKI